MRTLPPITILPKKWSIAYAGSAHSWGVPHLVSLGDKSPANILAVLRKSAAAIGLQSSAGDWIYARLSDAAILAALVI